VEHQRSNADIAVLLEEPRLPAAVNKPGQITFEHDGAAPASLGSFRSQSNRPVEDVFTRECLAVEVDVALTSARVVGVLERLVAARGAPAVITVDNVLTASA
jgi:putative transposase